MCFEPAPCFATLLTFEMLWPMFAEAATQDRGTMEAAKDELGNELM